MTRWLIGAVLATLALASGASADTQRGFNFTTWHYDTYAGPEAAESLRRLAATGANAVSLIPTWYQPSRRATRIAPDPVRSPTDESVAVAAARARELGLKVFLRPVVETDDGAPRSAIRPRSLRAWFRSYRAFIGHYADLAQSLHADLLSVGLEYRLVDGPRRTAQWRRVIRGVRARFKGGLTYGATGADAWNRIRFWDALDLIGIDAYFPLSSGRPPSERELVRRWRRYRDRFGVTHRYLHAMAALARRQRKPILFTEFGYPSTARALAAPWATGGRYSAEAQRRGFDAAFRALAGRRWFKGLYIWDWSADPLAGGPGDTGHTPQGKPAENTVRDWFTREAAR